ncbi:hypothetical protein NQZ68_041573 [Dissostichus eleginoides]|nr:hypothetical protein NQZ68_041573 [Dissostichus eleginoides]
MQICYLLILSQTTRISCSQNGTRTAVTLMMKFHHGKGRVAEVGLLLLSQEKENPGSVAEFLPLQERQKKNSGGTTERRMTKHQSH